MAMAAARIGRLAKMRAGWRAWRARSLAAKEAKLASKARILRKKTVIAKEKATIKGYRKGTLSPITGQPMGKGMGAGGVAAAGSVPIGAGLAASALGGVGGAFGKVAEAAGDAASALLGREGQQIPDIDESAGAFPNVVPRTTREDRAFYLKLARLEARTRVRLAQKQRETAREVAFLSSPLVGAGLGFAVGMGAYYGIHALAEMKDSGGSYTPMASAAQATVAKTEPPKMPSLPTSWGSTGSSGF